MLMNPGRSTLCSFCQGFKTSNIFIKFKRIVAVQCFGAGRQPAEQTATSFRLRILGLCRGRHSNAFYLFLPRVFNWVQFSLVDRLFFEIMVSQHQWGNSSKVNNLQCLLIISLRNFQLTSPPQQQHLSLQLFTCQILHQKKGK